MKKMALVTGGASGIGEAIARRLASDGFKVIIMDLNESKGRMTVEWIRDATGNDEVSSFTLDVCDELSVSRFFQEQLPLLSGLDLLVNNAATANPKPLLHTTGNEWDHLFNVNLKSVFLMCKYAHPLLKLRKGSVINMGSSMGLHIYPGNLGYSVTKAGLHHFTKVLAKEWLEDGIRVNAVCPATVDTPLLRKNMTKKGKTEKEVQELIAEGIQGGRIQTPEEIASVVSMLAHSDSAILTGKCIEADGGSQLK